MPSTLSTMNQATISGEMKTENSNDINLDIELLSGEKVTLSGTTADIIRLRAELVLAGKLPNYMEFDEEAKRNNRESKDLDRRLYRGDSKDIIDLETERNNRELEKKKKEKLLKDIIDAFDNGTLQITRRIHRSKDALIDILIISEEKLKFLITKQGLKETGDVLGDIVDKGIEYTMPQLHGTLPHIKKKLYMTGKQLVDILTGKFLWEKEKKKRKKKIQ